MSRFRHLIIGGTAACGVLLIQYVAALAWFGSPTALNAWLRGRELHVQPVATIVSTGDGRLPIARVRIRNLTRGTVSVDSVDSGCQCAVAEHLPLNLSGHGEGIVELRLSSSDFAPTVVRVCYERNSGGDASIGMTTAVLRGST